ncbi:MAG: GtrA family protein [Actinomycetota bacterium]
MSVLRRLRDRFEHLVHEVAKFGVVGGVAYAVDVGTFNFFRLGLGLGPLTSKTISTLLSLTLAYFGNRHWTFRHRARSGFTREYVLFAVINGAGLVITLSFLAVSHYVLDLRSALADNISGNVLGVGTATLFRFWAYRRFVFLHHPGAVPVDATEAVAEATAPARDAAASAPGRPPTP